MSLLLKNCKRIVTMNQDEAVLEAADILIEGRDIARVGRLNADESVGAPDTRVIDATGLTAIPGLVQTHVHLCQTGLRNTADDRELLDWLKYSVWPGEGALDRAALRLAARMGIAELLRGGTTCILDMATMRYTEEVLEAMRESGLRGITGKCLMDDRDICPPELVEDTRDALVETERLVADWHGAEEGRIGVAITPRFAVSCTHELLEACIAVADAGGLLIHTHASENRAEIELVRRKTGLGNLEYFEKLGLLSPRACLAHCVHLEPGDMERLRDSQASVLHCPTSNLKLASGVAPIPEMIDAGVRVSIGADGAPCNNRLDAFSEMRLAALVHKPAFGARAMPAREVFRLMTVEGARTLGLDHEIARLEPGYRADVVLIDLEQEHTMPADNVYAALVYAARASDVSHVIVGGRVLVDAGQLTYADLNEWKREFTATFSGR